MEDCDCNKVRQHFTWWHRLVHQHVFATKEDMGFMLCRVRMRPYTKARVYKVPGTSHAYLMSGEVFNQVVLANNNIEAMSIIRKERNNVAREGV